MATCLSFLVGASTGVGAAFLHSLWQRKHTDSVRESEGNAATTKNHKGVTEVVLPDLQQVHLKVALVADRIKRPSDLHYLSLLPSEYGRKWMFYLVPIWQWDASAPKAAQFWKLAHGVSRDQKNDDWITTHVTLHSRVDDLKILIEKFEKMLADLRKDDWKEVLLTLQNETNWTFDDDTHKHPPTNPNHHVLHKAKIRCPEPLRAWLDQNLNAKRFKPRTDDLHISLYSFRVKGLPEPAALEHTPSHEITEPRVAHHTLPTENDIRIDLSRAMWTLVLMSPGRTDACVQVPQVLSAVSLYRLASEAWKQ